MLKAGLFKAFIKNPPFRQIPGQAVGFNVDIGAKDSHLLPALLMAIFNRRDYDAAAID